MDDTGNSTTFGSYSFFGLVERQKKKKIKSFGQLNTGRERKWWMNNQWIYLHLATQPKVAELRCAVWPTTASIPDGLHAPFVPSVRPKPRRKGLWPRPFKKRKKKKERQDIPPFIIIIRLCVYNTIDEKEEEEEEETLANTNRRAHPWLATSNQQDGPVSFPLRADSKAIDFASLCVCVYICNLLPSRYYPSSH